ncbi:MAG: hypothetical protein UT05_C0001G0124 [Parcubacteria group bacterium GW2011_GWF2_38_76]|nr:MAG: hypothetical protein UT05_C0001G0124 [Parcubacteria group bacterium GW2011_GWF2_38_76]
MKIFRGRGIPVPISWVVVIVGLIHPGLALIIAVLALYELESLVG